MVTPLSHASPSCQARRICDNLLFGIAVGVIAATLALAFVRVFTWLFAFLFPPGAGAHVGVAWQWDWRVLFFPACAGLICGGLLRATKLKRYFNLADVIDLAQTGGRGQSLKDDSLSAAAAIVALGGGASVGHYGALAAFGATLGAQLSRIFTRVRGANARNLGLGCGVAAVIAGVFGAPIAGVIFAHEAILRHYSLRAFAPIALAASAGFFINAVILGRAPLLEIHAARSVFAPEFLGFIAVGVCAAMVAVLLMRAVLAAEDLAHRLRLPGFIKPALAGLAVGLLAQSAPMILGNGALAIKTLALGATFPPVELLALLLLKILATALCIGFGFAGGMFSPALLVGALFGAIFGQGAEWLFGDAVSPMSFYAVCGMMAVTAAVIGAPLAVIVIAFELTHNYELTIAVMLSVVFSHVIVARCFGRSLFDRQLLRRGLDLSRGRIEAMLQRARLHEFVRRDAARASDAVALDENDSLLLAVQIFRNREVDAVAVRNSAGDAVGVIHRAEIMRAYLKIIEAAREEEHAMH